MLPRNLASMRSPFPLSLRVVRPVTPLAKVSTPASLISGQKDRSRDRRREHALASSNAPGHRGRGKGDERRGGGEGRGGEEGGRCGSVM